ncbi:MAG: hypothetical protein WD359_04320 [Dehalococcoidia bacterium]
MSVLAIAALLTFLAACGGDDGERDVDMPDTPAGESTPAVDTVPPGTVALFDMDALTAEGLDLGRAIIRAEWVDDGETIVAFDANTQTWVALGIDGALVREIAPQVTSSGEGSPVTVLGAVGDGRRVAMADLRTGSFELIDVASGDSEVLFSGARAFGYFSSRGEYLAGGTTPVDSTGMLDREASVFGVFAADGDCGDATSYACIEWEWPSEENIARFPANNPWSADGAHLLLARQAICPPDEPGAPPEPCSPDPTFEVYSWPQRELVLAVPSSSGNGARWAGTGALFIDGSFDESIGAARYLMTLDGEKRALPEILHGFSVSFSPDGRHAIASAIPGEDCSLIEVATGDVLASVAAGAGDTNDTGICQHVSWSPDGRWAIASGVNTP